MELQVNDFELGKIVFDSPQIGNEILQDPRNIFQNTALRELVIQMVNDQEKDLDLVR